MPRRVERTEPGSKLKWRITYDSGAKKWTNDFPGDDEGSDKEDKKLFRDLRVKRGIERIENAVVSYAEGEDAKPIRTAVGLLEQYIGEDSAKTVVRAIYNAVKGKGGKIEKGVEIAKDHVNRERKVAMSIVRELTKLAREVMSGGLEWPEPTGWMAENAEKVEKESSMPLE